MLTRERFFRAVLENADARKFVLNALAVGERDGGKELARVADHCSDIDLRQRVKKHFRDEIRHSVLFGRILRRTGAQLAKLEPELDYEAAIQRLGIGLSSTRLDDPRPFDTDDYVRLFCCIRVTEDRAWSNTCVLRVGFSRDAELSSTLEQVLKDEAWHREYATEELRRLCGQGCREQVRRLLRSYRKQEARAYLSVTIPYVDKMTRILGYGRWSRGIMKLACVGEYLYARMRLVLASEQAA